MNGLALRQCLTKRSIVFKLCTRKRSIWRTFTRFPCIQTNFNNRRMAYEACLRFVNNYRHLSNSFQSIFTSFRNCLWRKFFSGGWDSNPPPLDSPPLSSPGRLGDDWETKNDSLWWPPGEQRSARWQCLCSVWNLTSFSCLMKERFPDLI